MERPFLSLDIVSDYEKSSCLGSRYRRKSSSKLLLGAYQDTMFLTQAIRKS